VKTANQQVFSDYTHDKIYKGIDYIRNNSEVQQYTKRLSYWIYEIDQGRTV
jgi:hypothetical protein